MKTVTLLYSTDCNHTTSSRCLHGVFGTRLDALGAIHKLIEVKSNEAGVLGHAVPGLRDEDEDFFLRFGQTQGYEGEGEWDTQTLPLNKIDCWL